MLLSLLCLLGLWPSYAAALGGPGRTYAATRNSLLAAAAAANSDTAAQNRGLRTGFHRALHQIERSISEAETENQGNHYHGYQRSQRRRELVRLRRGVVVAARRGHFSLGRSLFGITRVVEDTIDSLSRSTRRHRRSASSFLDFLKRKLGGQTFNQFFSIDSDTALTFVLDTTGSMDEDIDEVKGIVRHIFRSASPSSGYSTYTLVPFRDPHYGPVQSFHDKRPFLASLENLQAIGGGDCDEVVLRAIHEALTEVDSVSPLFVFTDADTKHKEEMEDVIHMGQWMQVPIYFFLTPSETCQKDLATYLRIAEQTGGQVLSIEKPDVGQMSNLVQSTGVGRATITSGSIGGGGGGRKRRSSEGGEELQLHSVHFPSDETIETLMVSVNSERTGAKVELSGPDGSQIAPTVALAHALLFEVQRPPAGNWLLTSRTDGFLSYRVDSVSPTSIDFSYFFVEAGQPVDNIIPGSTVGVVVNILGDADGLLDAGKELVTLSLVSPESGAPMTTVENMRHVRDNQYRGNFTVPVSPFRLRLVGRGVACVTQDCPRPREDAIMRSTPHIINPTYGRIIIVGGRASQVQVSPGSTGALSFVFTHIHPTDTDFTLDIFDSDSILSSPTRSYLVGVASGEERGLEVRYAISAKLTEGKEIRLLLTITGENFKVTYLHTAIVTRSFN